MIIRRSVQMESLLCLEMIATRSYKPSTKPVAPAGAASLRGESREKIVTLSSLTSSSQYAALSGV